MKQTHCNFKKKKAFLHFFVYSIRSIISSKMCIVSILCGKHHLRVELTGSIALAYAEIVKIFAFERCLLTIITSVGVWFDNKGGKEGKGLATACNYALSLLRMDLHSLYTCSIIHSRRGEGIKIAGNKCFSISCNRACG